jgi:hypothetical protein
MEALWKPSAPATMAAEPITRFPPAERRRRGRPPTHGAYAKALPPAIRDRATEICELLMSLPHTVEADRLAAEECGRLAALLESIDADIAQHGAVTGRGHAPRRILDVRARYSRELRAWLEAFGGTPASRAEWAKAMAEGASLAEEIARRRRERDRG